MSMSQRVDQIMKIPKVDGRPEMYRIDVRMEEDLRTLHEQQSKRDPEIHTQKLARPVPGTDKNQSSYDFLDAGEVVSTVGDSSTGGGRSDRLRPSQKKHVPPINTVKLGTTTAERRHVESSSGAAPWERSPGAKAQGRQQSPRSNASNQDLLSASPIEGRVRRTHSGRSEVSGGSLYEFAPSLHQLKAAGVAVQANGVSPRDALRVSPRRSVNGNAASRVSPRSATLSPFAPGDVVFLPPALGGDQTASAPAAKSSNTPTKRRDSPLTSPKHTAEAAPPADQSSRVVEEAPAVYPTTRGASQTAGFRPGLRQQRTITAFERNQPQNTLPPRPLPRNASPRGVLLDFSHDSHFTSFSQSDNTTNVSGMRAPRIITVGKVSSPNRPFNSLRSQSPPAVGNPNVLAPEVPTPKRLARSVTPPGGRRGSSGIFDVPTNATSAAARALLLPKKSLANMDRLRVNTQTSTENTLISPSMEGKTDVQHAAANASPLRRTMSSLQTHNLSSKTADSLKAAVPQGAAHVSRRMVVRCPHALRLQSSTQVAVNMCWQ